VTVPHRRWIILSPHLDDGPLSLGGLIVALTGFVRVEVWSLFCGATLRGPYSPLAQWLHSSSGLAGGRLSWARKLEDRRACRRLGASARHFPWMDAPYRKTAVKQFMYSELHGPVHDGDFELAHRIGRHLAGMIEDDDLVLSPLAIGGHVDHVITRKAAESVQPAAIMYYPEIPYMQLHREDAATATAGFCPVQYTLRRDEIVTWIDSLKLYVTQMEMLESAAGNLPQLIREHAASAPSLYRKCDRDEPGLTAYRIFR
jgi:LmbE family N-acetylglucosaminyl deacetylase